MTNQIPNPKNKYDLIERTAIIVLITIALVFGGVVSWRSSRDEKVKASQPENQVKAFLKTVQKKTPDFFTDNPDGLKTNELKLLQEKNKELQATFAQSRIKDISDLKQKIGDTIQRNRLGWGKTAADKEKIKQVEFLESLATEPYQKTADQDQSILTLLSDLKNSSHFRTYYNEESKTSREVLPTLVYQIQSRTLDREKSDSSKDQKLNTAETPYEITLPQKDSPELKFNQQSGAGETKLTFTLKNSNLTNPKVYDNQALYSEIKKGADQLLTTQADGLTQSYIIKNPLSLEVKDDAGFLTLDYELTTDLVAKEEGGIIILTDQNNIKQYVLTPPILTDIKKQTPGEVKFKLSEKEEDEYQLQIEVKISKVASFPLLIKYSILPALTRYVK